MPTLKKELQSELSVAVHAIGAGPMIAGDEARRRTLISVDQEIL
jgi:hypothetical protein